MSGTESADEDSRAVTVEEDGVRIEKSLTLEEFDTPAVVFTVTSDRDGTTRLKITDPLPATVDPDDVGLHPEYDSEGWRRRGGDLQFEGRIDPTEHIETVYGLRVAGVDQPSVLLTTPEIDEVVDATEDTTGDGGLDLDLDDGEVTVDDDGGVDLDVGDAGTAADDTTDRSDAVRTVGADTSAGTSVAGTVETDTVAAALVDELERGRVDEETRAALNEHLQPGLPMSTETRLDRIQARLDDLEAYTDALERILDRVGDDDDVVSELESMRDRVAALEDRTDDLSDDVSFTETRLDSLTDLDDDVAALRDDLAAVEDDVEVVREAVPDDLDTEIDEIRAEIEAIQEWRETLASTLAGGE